MSNFTAQSGDVLFDFFFHSPGNLLLLVQTSKARRLRFTVCLKFDHVEFIKTDDGCVRQLFLESTPEGNMVRMILSYKSELEINVGNEPFPWPPNGPVQFN